MKSTCMHVCVYVYSTDDAPKLIKNSCSSLSAAQFVRPPINAYQYDLQLHILSHLTNSPEGYAEVMWYEMSPPLIFASF